MKNQKSKIFKNTFLKIVEEDITSTTSGIGPTDIENVNQFSGDTYAKGDNRIPTVLGSKKKNKKIFIQRRNKIGM